MKQASHIRFPILFLFGMTVAGLSGCVERLIHVRSEPPGAIVWLNGEEVGATPVSVPFTFYGEYEVILRKSGYETLHTSRKADEPFYEWLGVDLISEVLLPVTLTDEHHWDFTLTELSAPDPNQIIERAIQLQREL